MKKNKFQKGKSLAIAVFGLAAVAVVGVGFSSWVISFKSANQTADVNVEVANTSGDVVIIEKKNKQQDTWFASGSDGNFVLDSTEKSGGAFLNSQGTLKTCVLQQTVEFVVYVSPSATGFTGVYAKFGPSETNGNFNTAITQNYLEASLGTATPILGNDCNAITAATVTVGTNETPLTTVSSTVTASVSEEGIYKGYKKAEVSLTFGFAWGSAFGYVNPTIYFNDSASPKTGELTKDAPTALAALTVVSGIDPKNANSESGHAPFTLTIGLTNTL